MRLDPEEQIIAAAVEEAGVVPILVNASGTQPCGGSVSSTALHRIRQGPLTGSLLRRVRQSSNRAPWPAPPAHAKW